MPTATDRRIYGENDPDMPEELRELLVRMLVHHVENTTNPYWVADTCEFARKCMTLPPDEKLKTTFAKLIAQEFEHGVINARILAGLGHGPVEQPIKQYFFHLPIESFCDLAFFNALGDRVGCYIGETWQDVPYEPLRNVAERLHRDEVFHCTFGMSNLRRVCATPEGLAEADERVKIWWPAALDMFGRSDSTASDAYVRWGLRQKNNAELRQQYAADTRPLLEELGITVPPDTDNRRYL